jgi:hypothetical protein
LMNCSAESGIERKWEKRWNRRDRRVRRDATGQSQAGMVWRLVGGER